MFQTRLSGNSFVVGTVEAWLFLSRAMLSQGAPNSTRSSGLRVFLAVWFTSCLVLTTAYTSKLVALLTRPTYSGHIHTLQQLAQSDLRQVYLRMLHLGMYICTYLRLYYVCMYYVGTTHLHR